MSARWHCLLELTSREAGRVMFRHRLRTRGQAACSCRSSRHDRRGHPSPLGNQSPRRASLAGRTSTFAPGTQLPGAPILDLGPFAVTGLCPRRSRASIGRSPIRRAGRPYAKNLKQGCATMPGSSRISRSASQPRAPLRRLPSTDPSGSGVVDGSVPQIATDYGTTYYATSA